MSDLQETAVDLGHEQRFSVDELEVFAGMGGQAVRATVEGSATGETRRDTPASVQRSMGLICLSPTVHAPTYTPSAFTAIRT